MMGNGEIGIPIECWTKPKLTPVWISDFFQRVKVKVHEQNIINFNVQKNFLHPPPKHFEAK